MATTDNTYAGNSLDNYLENTWYASLTDKAKAAIVTKTFTQDSWYWGTSGSPVYSGYDGTTNPGTTAYSVSLASASYREAITRHCYVLSMQDVIDYVTDTSVGDGQLQNYNIWKMFWNTTSQPTTFEFPWLRSANADYSSTAWGVDYYDGLVGGNNGSNSFAVRPAFTIDLSKIEWN